MRGSAWVSVRVSVIEFSAVTSEATENRKLRKLRILVAKVGLDGHDRGAKVVARGLADAGYEVIYSGLHQTPEMVAAAAAQESVDAVGLSIMSGAHMTHFPAVRAALDARGGKEVVLFGGGIVPDEDATALKGAGVAAIFTPGTSTQAIVEWIERELRPRVDGAVSLIGGLLRGASVAAALAVILSSSARAQAGVQPEENRIADILQSALVAHGAEVNRCFERALADTLDVAGKIELSVDVGAAGKITRAEPALDEVKSPVLLACLEASALTWSLVGIDPGSTVVVPLAFEGQAAQFTIKVADAPDHGPPAPKHKAGGAAPPAPPFSVKLLVDQATMHAQKVAVAQLTVAPANRIALHRHPGAELLYVLRGHARVLGAAGVAAEKLDEGMAIYIPPSMPHAIENMGRQTAAVLLDVFVPPGPEKVYRDPKDPEGRAAFEVLHDPKVASPEGAKFVVSAPVAARRGAALWRQGEGDAAPRRGPHRQSRRLPRQAGGRPGSRGSAPFAPGRRGDHLRHRRSRRIDRRQRKIPLRSVRGALHSRRTTPRREVHRDRQGRAGADLRPRRPRRPLQGRHQGQTMIDFELTDDQRVLQKSVRELCDRLIVPNAKSWDEEERFPHEVVKPMGEMGLFGMQVPEQYGGAGMKCHDFVVALEEVARADASVGLTMASHNSLCTGHILLAGNEAQKQKYLPRLASGEVLGGWGLTEPGSGSDAGAARTRAVRQAERRQVGHQRHEDLHHPGVGGRRVRGDGLDQPREEGQGVDRVHRRARDAGLSHRQEDPQDGAARLRHDGADLRGRDRR